MGMNIPWLLFDLSKLPSRWQPNTFLTLLKFRIAGMKCAKGKTLLHPGADDERNNKNRRLVHCFGFLGSGSFFPAKNLELSKVAVRSAWLLH